MSLWLAACAETPVVSSSDTGADPVERVLVVPGAEGLTLFDEAGEVAWFEPWDGLLGACVDCGGEGASIDDDGGVLVTYTTEPVPGNTPGGVARLDPSLTLDFRLDGYDFPHDAVRDPVDGALLVAETSENRLIWLAGDGSSGEPVRVLDRDGGLASLPNGLERFEHDGRVFALVTHRGSGAGPGPIGAALGSIALWDVSTPGEPALAWSFPGDGTLDTPHGAALRQLDGRWWLVWAHTGGAGSVGTIGLAVTDDPTRLPDYVADLELPGELGPLDFVRGVELDERGELVVVDSGDLQPGAEKLGRVFRGPMPELEPTGASGAVNVDQVFVELVGAELWASGLANPFEGFWWANPPVP